MEVPIRKQGSRPAFAYLQIAIFETAIIAASSGAVIARPKWAMRSASAVGWRRLPNWISGLTRFGL